MAWRRLIIHGSQEEMEMFEAIYETRLRLQHGALASRFHLPDPPQRVGESEEDAADEGIVEAGAGNIHRSADELEGSHAAHAEIAACYGSSSDNEDSNVDSAPVLPDHVILPRSTSSTDDRRDVAGFADNDNVAELLQGDGVPETPGDSARLGSDSDADSDSDNLRARINDSDVPED